MGNANEETNSTSVAARPRQAEDAVAIAPWAESSVWTARMWTALENGVTSRNSGCSLLSQPGNLHVHPLDGKTINWRAVCGRSARTVRREGRRKPLRRPYPYHELVLSKHFSPRGRRTPFAEGALKVDEGSCRDRPPLGMITRRDASSTLTTAIPDWLCSTVGDGLPTRVYLVFEFCACRKRVTDPW